MDAKARKALRTIQDCVASGRYIVLAHFVQRMDVRGLFWPDIQAVIDSAQVVRDDGPDRLRRVKWRVRGRTTDRLDLEIVCALDRDQRGNLTVFITAYWDRGNRR
jgi:hypothetical protein